MSTHTPHGRRYKHTTAHTQITGPLHTRKVTAKPKQTQNSQTTRSTPRKCLFSRSIARLPHSFGCWILVSCHTLMLTTLLATGMSRCPSTATTKAPIRTEASTAANLWHIVRPHHFLLVNKRLEATFAFHVGTNFP
jgi:hypothetical protein